MSPEQLTGSSSGLQWVTAGRTPAEARATLMTLSCHLPAPSSGRPSRHASPSIAQLPEETSSSGQGAERSASGHLARRPLLNSHLCKSLREQETRARSPTFPHSHQAGSLSYMFSKLSLSPRAHNIPQQAGLMLQGRTFPGSYRVKATGWWL